MLGSEDEDFEQLLRDEQEIEAERTMQHQQPPELVRGVATTPAARSSQRSRTTRGAEPSMLRHRTASTCERTRGRGERA